MSVATQERRMSFKQAQVERMATRWLNVYMCCADFKTTAQFSTGMTPLTINIAAWCSYAETCSVAGLWKSVTTYARDYLGLLVCKAQLKYEREEIMCLLHMLPYPFSAPRIIVRVQWRGLHKYARLRKLGMFACLLVRLFILFFHPDFRFHTTATPS